MAECAYPDCGHTGRYQRVIIDSRKGVEIRRTDQIYCSSHWWDIEEKKK